MVLRVISYCLRGIGGPYPGKHVCLSGYRVFAQSATRADELSVRGRAALSIERAGADPKRCVADKSTAPERVKPFASDVDGV